ncbi:MAG TPA: sigma-70 family RNA polymerase sigma factor [Pyrinomonadaceae bacterium]|jgi:RNA polymerase sigma-70 factor (ECF subfamily)|nr:sigma-70 family RNA polymerase sigma factor [Pyrinomonadaceae bacterium]
MSSHSTVLPNDTLVSRADATAGELHLRAERTDNQLVELVLAGDMYAFEQLFDRYKRMVAVVASRYFRRHEEIEELVQVAFAKSYTELGKFNGKFERSFASWLSRITVNTCFDALRSKRRRPETLNCDLSDQETDAMLEASASGRADHAALQNRDLADKLLSQLEPRDRALLEMLYTDEMSVAEIADVMGTSQSNVKVRAWRARRYLRKVLGQLL